MRALLSTEAALGGKNRGMLTMISAPVTIETDRMMVETSLTSHLWHEERCSIYAARDPQGKTIATTLTSLRSFFRSEPTRRGEQCLLNLVANRLCFDKELKPKGVAF